MREGQDYVVRPRITLNVVSKKLSFESVLFSLRVIKNLLSFLCLFLQLIPRNVYAARKSRLISAYNGCLAKFLFLYQTNISTNKLV